MLRISQHYMTVFTSSFTNALLKIFLTVSPKSAYEGGIYIGHAMSIGHHGETMRRVYLGLLQEWGGATVTTLLAAVGLILGQLQLAQLKGKVKSIPAFLKLDLHDISFSIP